MFIVSWPWTLIFPRIKAMPSVYMCSHPQAWHAMQGLILLLVGPQGSRWRLSSTSQTWEVQARPSLAGRTLLLSEAFSKQAECFKGEETKTMSHKSISWAPAVPPKAKWKGNCDDWHWPLLSQGHRFCSSLPNSAFSDVTLGAWNQPRWEYLYHRNWQMLKI